MTVTPPPEFVKRVWSAIAVSVAEWLFVIFPLVVVSIVVLNIGEPSLLVRSQEWAFGAAILAAQALFRFVGGIARARRTSVNRVLLGVAIMLVAVVGPTNIILAMVVSSEARHQTLSRGLSISQSVFFWVSSVVFVVLAAVGNLWEERQKP
jgi:hypothetical protein